MSTPDSPTTYTIPTDPADPESAALELIVGCPPKWPPSGNELVNAFTSALPRSK